MRHLRAELKTMKKGTRSISEFVTRVRALASSLSAIGDNISDWDLVDVVLEGLPEEYSSLVMIVYHKAGDIDLIDLESMLLVQEAQLDKFRQELATPAMSANLVHVNSMNNAPGRGSGYQGRAPYRGRGRSPRGRGRGCARNDSNRPTCQVCNRVGHIALDCWYKFDEGYVYQASQVPATATGSTESQPSNKSQGEASTSGNPAPQALAAYTAFDPTAAELYTMPPEITPEGWYADTCASNHFTAILYEMLHRQTYTGTQ